MVNEVKKRKVFRFLLPLLLSAIVLLIQTVVYIAIVATLIFLHQLQLINLYQLPQLFPLTLSLSSLVIGALFAAILLRRPLRPLQEIMDATDRIANGDYSVRVQPKGLSEFRRLGEKFNHMAEELESVELLRSDFVNNFSHEFKTPIVSIRGFAKMLQNGDLAPQERDEYLGIIIEESERLTSLSTHVLELSKLERQSILTDREPFLLSEQLRLCAAMLSTKWEQKHICFDLTCEELRYCGSEELLKQVWINLFDNAIKFSPDGGEIRVTAGQTPDAVIVSVFNTGMPIPLEAASHLFEKFYQADASRTTGGNGLGLSIAKRIVDLHDGAVSVASDPTGNTFTVTLPLNSADAPQPTAN